MPCLLSVSRLLCWYSTAVETAAVGSGGAQAFSVVLPGHPQLRLYTRSCRLEMYVSERTWERLPTCAAFQWSLWSIVSFFARAGTRAHLTYQQKMTCTCQDKAS